MKKEIIPVKLKHYKGKSVVLESLVLNGMITAKNNESIDTIVKTAFLKGLPRIQRTAGELNIIDTTYEEVKPEQLNDGTTDVK